MRGKEQDQRHRRLHPWITPACAGKSTKSRNAIRSRWDHPRMCGEKSSRITWKFSCRGSPPRMRGKAIAQTSSCRRTGITPAYAGKSFVSFFHCTTFWDHPRVCGEKVGGISARSCCTGSPPRMRGKAGFAMYLDVSARITPAYAGKRKSCAAQKTSAWDHPRMCGEKASHSATLFGVGGSPPHVRGKVGRTLYLVAGERITPAYAGKSFLQRTAQCRCQDHPRVCGEKTKKIP